MSIENGEFAIKISEGFSA